MNVVFILILSMKGLNALSLSLFVHDLIQTAKNFTVLPFFPFCFVHIYNLFFFFFFALLYTPENASSHNFDLRFFTLFTLVLVLVALQNFEHYYLCFNFVCFGFICLHTFFFVSFV